MSFATYMVPYDYQQPKTNEQKSGIHIHQQIPNTTRRAVRPLQDESIIVQPSNE